MDAFMFSDFVHAIRAVVSLPPGAYLPLATFLLVFLFLGKLFLGFIRRAHWAVLVSIALALFGFVGQFLNERQHVLAILFFIPTAVIARQIYFKLLHVSEQ